MNRANRIYTITLLVLAFFFIVAAAQFVFLRRSTAISDSGKWVFQFCSFLYGLYAGAIIATLIVRWRAPDAGRLVTKALNIVLLPLVPFGTVIGIYGLWKVDKEPSAGS